jgi:hypothetical protein
MGEVKIRMENGIPRYARLNKKMVEKKLEKWEKK